MFKTRFKIADKDIYHITSKNHYMLKRFEVEGKY